MNRNKLISDCTVSEFKEIICDLIDYYVEKTKPTMVPSDTVDCTGKVRYYQTSTPLDDNTIKCSSSVIAKMTSQVIDDFNLSEEGYKKATVSHTGPAVPDTHELLKNFQNQGEI